MLVDVSLATTYPFGFSGFCEDLKGEVRLKSLLNRLCRAPLGGKVRRKGWLRIDKVAGSSPAERAKESPANRGVFLLRWFRPLHYSDWVLPYCISMRARYMLSPPPRPAWGKELIFPRPNV